VSKSELIISFEYCISLRNSSKFFPNIRTTLFFAWTDNFISFSSLSRSLVVDPIIEPGPLPLRTLPALIFAFFISLSCSDGLHLVPLVGVIPAPYAEIDAKDVITDSFVPPVAKWALLEELWLALPVGGAPSDVLLAGPLEEERFIKLPMPAVMPETTRVKLVFRAGDFSCCRSNFWRPSWSSLVFEPKLPLCTYLLYEDAALRTLLGRYFLIQETWTRACLAE